MRVSVRLKNKSVNMGTANLRDFNTRESSGASNDLAWAEHQYDAAYELYFSGDWRQAELLLKNAIVISPFEAKYHLLLAQVYSARGWLSMALSELHYVKRMDPDNKSAKSLEGLIKTRSVRNANGSGDRLGRSGWFGGVFAQAFAWLGCR